MSKFKPYNPNPRRNRVGDCTARAICKATGKTWDEVFVSLCTYGYVEKDYPSANHIWGKYLKVQGFKRYLIEDDLTVSEFCELHPKGTYILAIDGHVVCVQDGFYYDSWDSGEEIPVYYWVRE